MLTVNSTPRSKRLAEVLQKTGLVEKSGQGVDKMFANCIMEAKPLPDYGGTDDYQVSLRFGAEIRDVPFLIYIRQEQQKRPLHHKLNVFQLIAIYNVCFGTKQEDAQDVIDGLVDEGLLVRSKTGKLSMGKEYKRITKEMSGGKNGGINGGINGELNGELRAQLESQLNESQKKTLAYIRQNDGCQAKQVSAELDVPFSTIDKHIRVLLKVGLIKRLDGKKTGGYHAL